ncbi:hypothetical protein DIPPA_29370 [Diplonema papillatum]|nr:hypothetical protein DIPPA_29370 [Diplonema papillatum]
MRGTVAAVRRLIQPRMRCGRQRAYFRQSVQLRCVAYPFPTGFADTWKMLIGERPFSLLSLFLLLLAVSGIIWNSFGRYVFGLYFHRQLTEEITTPRPPADVVGSIRLATQDIARDIEEYVTSPPLAGQDHFLYITGPVASGKTTAVQHALSGKTGFFLLTVEEASTYTSLTTAVCEEVFKQQTCQSLGELAASLKKVDEFSRSHNNRPFALVINVRSTTNGRYSSDDMQRLASKLCALGRDLTYDLRCCAVILEASIPALTTAIHNERMGNIMEVLHTFPPSLDDFRLLAAGSVARDRTARKALGPHFEWAALAKSDAELIKLLDAPMLNGATLRQHVDDFFYRVEPNCRAFASLVAQEHQVPLGIERRIDEAHRRLQVLIGEESELLTEIAEAGPFGALPVETSRPKQADKVLKRQPQDSVVRMVGPSIVLQYHGLAYALLKAKHHLQDDAAIREKMSERGWVSMDHVPQAVSA